MRKTKGNEGEFKIITKRGGVEIVVYMNCGRNGQLSSKLIPLGLFWVIKGVSDKQPVSDPICRKSQYRPA